MKPFYTNQVLMKAGSIKVRHSAKKLYCMRTARAFRATEYMKLVTEYRRMKWKPLPLNPLQHESERMTLEHYAAKGVDSAWQVQERCCVKYAANPDLSQPWMKPWLTKKESNDRLDHKQ